MLDQIRLYKTQTIRFCAARDADFNRIAGGGLRVVDGKGNGWDPVAATSSRVYVRIGGQLRRMLGYDVLDGPTLYNPETNPCSPSIFTKLSKTSVPVDQNGWYQVRIDEGMTHPR